MKKFWEWMSNNYEDCGIVREISPKQMLIGYMIEYLNENNIKWEIDYDCPINPGWYSALELFIKGKLIIEE